MFKGTLFDIQKPTAANLCNRKAMLLAWEQGTGKTVLALAAAEKLFTLKKAQTALIIAPNALTWQWEDRIREFTDSDCILTTAKDKASRKYQPTSEIKYWIVPYSLFRRDFQQIKKFKWDIVIADEAQEFNNFASKTAQLVKQLNVAIHPQYRWALTGTAVSNKLGELYSIMYWVDKNFLPPWPTFKDNHLVENEFGVISTYKNLNSLNDHLQIKMDRKTHADMGGQMPALLEQVHKLQPTKEYENAQKELLNHLDEFIGNLTFDKEGNPQLPENSEVRKAFHKAKEQLYSRDKLDYAYRLCKHTLQERTFNKVVIFSTIKWPLYSLDSEYFGAFNHCTFFTGDQSMDEKRAAIEQFREGESNILLASNAGSTGLDLPFANYVIHLDVPFSHGLLDQRNKRITRISSNFRSVVVNYLIVDRSLEEFYYYIVKNKGKLASAALEGTADNVEVRPMSLRKFLEDV